MVKILTSMDIVHFNRAVELALEAETRGNLPIGCVISFEDKNIAEGKNAIWIPNFNPIRHAEIEALQHVPVDYWSYASKLILYTTLEPCVMCAAAILQFGIGQVLFGSADYYGGANRIFGHMPPYFEEQLEHVNWFGPAYQEKCDPLFHRTMNTVLSRQRTMTA
jgi:tRNA(Arg) A34 adenosine deaminase TadA